MTLPLKILVFKLGYIGDVDLNRVARLVNISPNIIHLAINDPIPNIGEPNIYGFAYGSDSLFGFFPVTDRNIIKVGINLAPLEGNFYTRTTGLDSILITLFQVEEICEKAERTKEEYIAQTIVTEALWLQYKAHKPGSHHSDLFHQDTRGCIFDFVGHKPDKVHKLKTGQIDPMCKGKLVAANVPESIVKATEKILMGIRRPTFFGSFARSMQNPLFSFVFGGLLFGMIINAISSMALGEFDSLNDYYIVVLLLFFVLAMAVGNYVWCIISNSRKT
jgi:hypothetical protein